MTLGLPDGIRACLFDLDGVLTQTAKVHAARLEADVRRLPARAGRADGRGRSRRSTPATTTTSTSTASRATTACARSSSRAASSCRRGARRPARRRDDRGLGNRKNELVLRLIDEHGVEPYEGSVALRARRRATPACAARSSPRARTAATCSQAAGIERPVRRARRRRRRRARAPAGQAGARHVPRRRRDARRRAGARPRCSRTRSPASRPGAPAASAASSASTASARPTALREHGADVVVEDLAELLERDDRPAPAFAVEPWARPRDATLDLDRARPDASRCSRCPTATSACAATSTRASRTALPGTYLNGFYEMRPLPYAEAGYGYPEAGPDDRQRHQRQAHPAARRRRAVRRPLRRAARARARARPARRDAAPRASSGARRPGSAVRVRSTRLVSFAQRGDRGDPATRSSRSTAAARVVVQSELVANEPLPRPSERPARGAPRCERRSTREEHAGHDLRAVLVHRTSTSGLRMAAAMDHVVDGPTDDRHDGREPSPTSRASTVTAELAARRSRCGSSSSSPTAGRAGARCRRCATRSTAALAEARHTGWDGLCGPARVPRRLLGARRRRDRRRRRAPAGGALRRCSTCCRPARGPSAGRSRPRA